MGIGHYLDRPFGNRFLCEVGFDVRKEPVTGVKMAVQRGVLTPVAIRRGGRWVRVEEVLDRWVEAGRWWIGEEERVCFRVLLPGGTVLHLCHRPASAIFELL